MQRVSEINPGNGFPCLGKKQHFLGSTITDTRNLKMLHAASSVTACSTAQPKIWCMV
jgi:hypothetical protein